jgi:hypothetical protein
MMDSETLCRAVSLLAWVLAENSIGGLEGNLGIFLLNERWVAMKLSKRLSHLYSENFSTTNVRARPAWIRITHIVLGAYKSTIQCNRIIAATLFLLPCVMSNL